MIEGSCHCGAIRWEYCLKPEHLVVCNCSLCRRINGLWAYGTISSIRVICAPNSLISYVQPEATLAMHSCKNCGSTTHYTSIPNTDPNSRVAVNMAMAAPADIADIRVRHFDGADSWQFID